MAAASSVKLLGHVSSPNALRARLALKIKGIDFEYIEEDLSNKSESLIKYNPVYKKVPVLVHNEQAVAESLIILEYIDEAWAHPPYLLPKDPYLRAKHRFWAAYLPPVIEVLRKTATTEGEEQANITNEWLEKLDLIEEGMKEIFPIGVPSFSEEVKPGYLDIVFYSLFGIYEVGEEVFGVKVIPPERYPLLVSWVKALNEVPEVQEVTPPTPKLVGLLKFLRQKYLSAA